MKWEKQEGLGIWLPKVRNEEVIGEIIGVNTAGMYGTQYEIQKADGEKILTPSHKVLQVRMAKAAVGTKVKIIYLGNEAPKVRGQNPTEMYEVYFEKA